MYTKDSATRTRQEAVGTVLGLTGVTIFSFSLIATKAAVPVFGGWTVGIGRAVVAGVLAAALLTLTKTPQPNAVIRKRLAVVSSGVVLGFPLFSALALQHVPASRGAVIVGVLPAATAVVATLRHGERPSLQFWLAASGGLVAIVSFAWLTGSDGYPEPADGLLILAVFAAAVGYAEGATISQQIGGWQTISWALVYSLPVTIVVTGLAILQHGAINLTTGAVVGFESPWVFWRLSILDMKESYEWTEEGSSSPVFG